MTDFYGQVAGAFRSSGLRVGLVGTGYVAKLRAEALQAADGAQVVAIAGHSWSRSQAIAQTFGAIALASWQGLVARSDLDLVIIATINRDHGAIARAALEAGKHVVVEYPLSLRVAEATALVHLAQVQGKLLHVEHIELLGGLHQALLQALPQVGKPLYARYATLSPKRPAPQQWTYHPQEFGFPLVGALSRIHRLTHAFGQVAAVSGQARFWHRDGTDFWPWDEPASSHFASCLCTAQLHFASGLLATVTYGKGSYIWQPERRLEVQGEVGGLVFDQDRGTLTQPDREQTLTVASRRGLFAQDTQLVIAALQDGKPLYVTPEGSLYALKVADAIRQATETGQTVALD